MHFGRSNIEFPFPHSATASTMHCLRNFFFIPLLLNFIIDSLEEEKNAEQTTKIKRKKNYLNCRHRQINREWTIGSNYMCCAQSSDGPYSHSMVATVAIVVHFRSVADGWHRSKYILNYRKYELNPMASSLFDSSPGWSASAQLSSFIVNGRHQQFVRLSVRRVLCAYNNFWCSLSCWFDANVVSSFFLCFEPLEKR